MIPPRDIDVVLLDMDGTLLDRHFDDYFWERHLPELYAERHGLDPDEATRQLVSRYTIHKNTLNWTDIDFWSEELGLDIPVLKEQMKHLIAVHPNVREFLASLRQQEKRTYLITNAHEKVLDIKMRETALCGFFNRCITAFELGAPKELQEFWHALQDEISFDPARTLFIDDNPDILKAAADYGIKYVLLKANANTRRPDTHNGEFPVVNDFGDLIPLLQMRDRQGD